MDRSTARFKRLKHGQLPGDYPKRVKIAMRERRETHVTYSTLLVPSPISETCAKSFRRGVEAKTRAVLKERARREVFRDLDGE